MPDTQSFRCDMYANESYTTQLTVGCQALQNLPRARSSTPHLHQDPQTMHESQIATLTQVQTGGP